jgi:hypothetical protein
MITNCVTCFQLKWEIKQNCPLHKKLPTVATKLHVQVLANVHEKYYRFWWKRPVGNTLSRSYQITSFGI